MGDDSTTTEQAVCELLPSGSLIVAVDGSMDSARAVHWGARQAALEHRPLAVVTAADVAPWQTDGWTVPLNGFRSRAARDLLDQARRMARAVVDGARQSHPDLTVHTLVTTGDARCVLVDLSLGAHLLVMGARGRGRLRSLLLGSVSAVATRYARCPVVICRHSACAAGLGVVVVADGSPESRPVIEFAFEQAALRRDRLTIVHSLSDAFITLYGPPVGTEAEQSGLEARQLVLAESVAGLSEKYPDVPVTRRPAYGLLDDAVLGHHSGWDLIVVGRHPLDASAQWFAGSVANTLIERAAATVAVVPETSAEP